MERCAVERWRCGVERCEVERCGVERCEVVWGGEV